MKGWWRLPDLRGQTVVCIASGPSLTGEDVQYCRGKAAIAVVSDNWRLVPEAVLMYAADLNWWHLYEGETRAFAGARVTQDRQAANLYGLTYIHGHPGYGGLHTQPGHVYNGGNSGFQLLNVVYHCGARRVVLLGYDMQKGIDGKRHWFGDHPGRLHKESPYGMWPVAFNRVAAQAPSLGLELINCTRRTAITDVPRMDLREALREPQYVGSTLFRPQDWEVAER